VQSHAKERRLPTRPAHPPYADSFRCVGSACEDTCCRGWSVPIDRAAYAKVQSLPAGPLRTLIDASILLAPPDAKASDGFGKGGFAKLRMTEQNQCPLLTADRLCRIHAECGEGFLSSTCATYPRIVHSIGGFEEKALALSCPEAARHVLLDPDLQPPTEEHARVALSAKARTAAPWLPPYFWPIRESVLKLVRYRAYPVWQRLFLLGVFCRRLDAIAHGELDRAIPAFLREFDATVASGTLRPAMETLPADLPAQLDVVLLLAGLMLHRSNVTQRFGECIHAFTTGIGNGPGATLESLAARYALAHDLDYMPFMRRHPHILENYLINTILRCQFPFGRDGMKQGEPFSMTREFTQLTAQFALMKGLLIGVAGFHAEAFSTAHVVHTVQAAGKHFEHHPEFLDLACALLTEKGMDGARGTAVLLRNTESAAVRKQTPAKSVPARPGGRPAPASPSSRPAAG
jgi:lysine-N-methylase